MIPHIVPRADFLRDPAAVLRRAAQTRTPITITDANGRPCAFVSHSRAVKRDHNDWSFNMASQKMKKATNEGLVVVRTYSAGVHCGTLMKRQGQEVTLANARRIWSWLGALSLHEVATRGIMGGKVSVEVPEILLLQAIEVIAASADAMAKIASFEVR